MNASVCSRGDVITADGLQYNVRQEAIGCICLKVLPSLTAAEQLMCTVTHTYLANVNRSCG